MAENPSLGTLSNLLNETSVVTTLNTNFSNISTAFQDVLARGGTSPNQMTSPLDMNSNRILNLPSPSSGQEPVRLTDVTNPPIAVSLPSLGGVITAASTLGGVLTTTFTNGTAGTGAVVLATSPTLSGTVTINGSIVDTTGSVTITGTGGITTRFVKLSGATAGTTTLQSATSGTASGTLTVPSATDTLVALTTSDTLVNKTLTFPVISSISNTGTVSIPTGTNTLVGRTTSDTLTNKTISGASNTLSGAGTFSATNDTNVTLTVSGTAAGSVFNTIGVTAGWTGTLSVARGGTAYTGGAFTTYTATLTPSVGSIVQSGNSAFLQIGKLAVISIAPTITSLTGGAATGSVQIAVPVAPIRDTYMTGKENVNTGLPIHVIISAGTTTSTSIRKVSDNSVWNPAANDKYAMGVVYEAQ